MDITSAAQSVRFSTMVQKLKACGQRMTPQRLTVLRILAESSEHLSAEQVYARVQPTYPMTSLATIYNTLTLLRDMGEVIEIDMGHDGCRYDGLHPFPHPHVICLQCNIITDAANLPALDDMASQVQQSTGFQIINHRLDFFGICPECQARQNQP